MVSSAATDMKTGKKEKNEPVIPTPLVVNPYPCPFRIFKDSELSPDTWGMGPLEMASPSARNLPKPNPKSIASIHEKKTRGDNLWHDPQMQPLMMSARLQLHQWKRADQLAYEMWGGDTIVYNENDTHGMSIKEMQMTYSDVICASLFVRMVLSACFMLEKIEGFVVEHQNENFNCVVGPEGWRVKYHIYTPGVKPGGGPQHKCTLSKNGCYLVRLFYLGAWRCVWVNDLVPVDDNDCSLLPFHPPVDPTTKVSKLKMMAQASEAPSCSVELWPLLLCKALLKLMSPNMLWDRVYAKQKGERQYEFDIMNSLTGGLNMTYFGIQEDRMWSIIKVEVPMFYWDDDDDATSSTAKTKSTKKIAVKDNVSLRRNSLVYATVHQTSDIPVYLLPGLVPSYENYTLIEMARDVPLKKPLPEPEVAPWKLYRWVDWNKSHGLYDAYYFPRTKFLKVTSLMKMSLAPHLLDVTSATSLAKLAKDQKDSKKDVKKGAAVKKVRMEEDNTAGSPRNKEEGHHDWVQFLPFVDLTRSIHVLSFPSMYQVITASNYPPQVNYKGGAPKNLDIQAPLHDPLYFEINGLQDQNLKISLATINPVILTNCRMPVKEYMEVTYFILESFEWFKDSEFPDAKGYLRTRGYDTIELNFRPGRHYFRLWVHSDLHWYITMLSNESMQMGPRDALMASTVEECPWTSKFLLGLGTSFANWLRLNKSQLISYEDSTNEFYQTYQPDLPWITETAGYPQKYTHWMFQKALESLLKKRLPIPDMEIICATLRTYFRNPDFGMPVKNLLHKNLRKLIANDPCDCVLPEIEEHEGYEIDEATTSPASPSPTAATVTDSLAEHLLSPPSSPYGSTICKYATDDMSCGILKQKREMLVRRHEAATRLQAAWRGTRARSYLQKEMVCPAEVFKILNEYVFGNMESLSLLMNEFFIMFPGTKHAYSLSSALNGGYKLDRYSGEVRVTTTCKWVPFFRKTFYCHKPVKVHVDLNASATYPTYSIYDNDTCLQLPQLFNAFMTFDIRPNVNGYTVKGYGTVNELYKDNIEAIWNLTVLCSTTDAFHVCDNNELGCKLLPLTSSAKFRLQEVFVPNRRNILGGINLSVTDNDTVSFRAAASSPDLNMMAVLKTQNLNGEFEEVDHCYGKGELYWPFIKLYANTASTTPIVPVDSKGKVKIKEPNLNVKVYTIELTALDGWPLTLDQWVRALAVLNSVNINHVPNEQMKDSKASREKLTVKPTTESKKDATAKVSQQKIEVEFGDAYVDIECAYNAHDAVTITRDDYRQLELYEAIKSWNASDVNRKERCNELRQQIRLETLVPTLVAESASSVSNKLEEQSSDDLSAPPNTQQQELSENQSEEEVPTYLTLPPELRDNFLPLDYLADCMRPKIDGIEIVMSASMEDAAEFERLDHIEKELDRMKELDVYNEVHVMDWQKTRTKRLEHLFVDHSWSTELEDALIARDEAIAQEIVSRQPKPKGDSGKKK